MCAMIADKLKADWEAGQKTGLSWEDFLTHQQHSLDEYVLIWKHALLRDPENDFRQSMLGELMRYLKLGNLVALEAWNQKVRHGVDWHAFDSSDRRAVEQYYNQCEMELYNL